MAATLGPGQQAVSLAVADPDLVRGVPEEDLPALRQATVAPTLRAEPGPWEPQPQGAAFAVLILEGMLTRELHVHSRMTAHLFGPGDVVEPWAQFDTIVPGRSHWVAGEAFTGAVFDVRWLLSVRRWPVLALRLHERLADQAARLALQHAIAGVPKVELRVLGMLWHLADRWGRVSPAGVVLPLRLTHEALGRLVGAQRPTITLALGVLEREGDVSRCDDGSYVLRVGSQERLTPRGLRGPLDAAADRHDRRTSGARFERPSAPLPAEPWPVGEAAPAQQANASEEPAALRTLVLHLRESRQRRTVRSAQLLDAPGTVAARSHEPRQASDVRRRPTEGPRE
jgi:CRP/FNR family transcriptional regulator, cyclic AMP receptor protein